MAQWNEPRPDLTGFGAKPGSLGGLDARTTFDEGLRRHMLSIYNYMTSGVLLTAIVAMLTANSGLAYTFASGPMMWPFPVGSCSACSRFSPGTGSR